MEPRSGCVINAAVEALGDQWFSLPECGCTRGIRIGDKRFGD